jgi:hypothetical protein
LVSIEQGVSVLPYYMDEPHIAQTVSHFLRKPMRLLDAVSQVASGKGLLEILRDKL